MFSITYGQLRPFGVGSLATMLATGFSSPFVAPAIDFAALSIV
jgi:hypothetical protein